MTNAEILWAVTYGLELNSLMINYHIILPAFPQICVKNAEITTAATAALVCLKFCGIMTKSPTAFLQNSLSLFFFPPSSVRSHRTDETE